jgi:hypothetical protein
MADKTKNQPDETIFRPKYGRDDQRYYQRKRIFEEIIVDCYQLSDFQKAWYHYLDEYIMFPFQADVLVRINNSGEYKIKTIDILALADEAYCAKDMFVKAETWGEYEYFYLPLSVLQNIQGAESTKQAIGDWQYWWSDYF